MREFCQLCGWLRRRNEIGCLCRSTMYGPTVPASVSVLPEPGPLSGPLGTVLELPPGCVMLLHGARGTGKTSVALQTLPGAWFISNEMSPGQIHQYAKRLGVKPGEITTTWEENGCTVLPLPNDFFYPPRDIILDSLTRCADPVATLRAIQDFAGEYGVRALLIAQQTKAGTARGSAELGHDADAEVRIDREPSGQRVAVIEKARHYVAGASHIDRIPFALGGGVAPIEKRYYSVEGPPLRLRPWPTTERARFADVYAHQERGGDLELPSPPVAVSAQRSRLYPSGWVEPLDWRERRRFALSQGVAHWSPTEGLADPTEPIESNTPQPGGPHGRDV